MSLRPSDIPASRVKELEAGLNDSRNLAELLAMDFGRLMRAACPSLPAATATAFNDLGRVGIIQRIELGGKLLAQHAASHLDTFATSPSDVVRSWACYANVREQRGTLRQRLSRVRPFADDANSGVREWAWMALRPAIISELPLAIELLEPWTIHTSPNIRRFATEATRPRGVWCAHITALKTNPTPALPLLEPLKADPTKYVQDSVSNWLNDAAKSDPKWVRSLTRRWQRESDTAATARICRRALRTCGEA
jgi:3-methyladenine DNA glycosylase AlkC